MLVYGIYFVGFLSYAVSLRQSRGVPIPDTPQQSYRFEKDSKDLINELLDHADESHPSQIRKSDLDHAYSDHATAPRPPISAYFKRAPGRLEWINHRMPIKVVEGVIKSDFDKSQYRHITLPNGLQALIVSEPSIDKSSAALDVNVGSFFDPEELPGLAHFLEHLLFMGTSKYPDENDYSAYLSAHSGSSNAYTTSEHTNFFFEVGADHFEGALDRFAQFFISPLFAEGGVERELLAVDSEHKKNLKSDSWRMHMVERTLSSRTCPFHKFSTGNLATLRDGPRSKGIDIRAVLIDFYQKHYSANLMRLVVYGKESLDELQEMVSTKFSAVPNADVAPHQWNCLPLEKANLGKLVRVQSVKELRSLHITWQLGDLSPYWQEKPDNYLSHLLGHEGKGSILSLLKKNGWATSLGAGGETSYKGFSFFQVNVELSKEGMSHIDEVIHIIFQYIHLLNKSGVREDIFEETRMLADLSFRFAEKGRASTFTHRTATNMHTYPPNHILAGPVVPQKFDRQLIEQVLSQLTTENFRVTLVSSDEIQGDATQTELYFGTKYSETPITTDLLDRLRNPTPNQDLFLPSKNPFIPSHLNINAMVKTNPTMHPQLIHEDDQYKLWHKLDDVYGLPKATFSFMVRTPIVYASPDSFIRIQLFCELFKEGITEELYEASLAGLTFHVEVLKEGISFTFTGYDEKIPTLVRFVLSQLETFTVKMEHYLSVVDKHRRHLESMIHDSPYHLTSYYLTGLQQEKHWWYWEKLDALKRVTPHDLTTIINEFFSKGKIEALSHGNHTAEEALSILDDVKGVFADFMRPIGGNEEAQLRTIELKDDQTLIFSPPVIPNTNNAIDIYLQIGSLGDIRTRNLAALFNQIFHEQFFDVLRTKEQLGYVVSLSVREKGPSVGLSFLIQSERHPLYLEHRIEEFISHTYDNVVQMPLETFEKHITSLINHKLAKKRRMLEETRMYWHQIIQQQYEFERIYVDARYLRHGLSKSDLVDFIHEHILIGSPKRKKLSVHLWSSDFVPERSQANRMLASQSGVLLIEDPETFSRHVSLFPFNYINPALPMTDIEDEVRPA